MKIMKLLLVAGILFAIMYSCKKEESSDLNKGSKKSLTTITGQFPSSYCNQEPTVLCLIAGQTINSGNVTIVNDATNLYVKFSVNGTLLESVHVWVGSDLADVPVNNQNIPVPGQFPYKVENINDDEVTVVIPLSAVPDECFYILAHASLTNGQTAWGGDCDVTKRMTFEDYFDITRWGFIGEYCPAACDDYIVLKLRYTTPSGSMQLALMGGAQNYYKSDWCRVLGVNMLSTATYDLVTPVNIKIGSVAVVKYSDHFTVDISFDTQGNNVIRTYLFYGTLAELAAYGDCPEYTQFPLPGINANQSSFSIPLN